MNSVIRASIAVAVLIVAGSVSYYLLVIQPRESQAQLNSQRQQAQRTIQGVVLEKPANVQHGQPDLGRLYPVLRRAEAATVSIRKCTSEKIGNKRATM